MNNDLFVRKIVFEREKVEDFNTYPFNIEVIKGLEEIELQKPVTFFVGENGIGKSTLIEAIAIALRLNPEGGSQNFCFSTKNTHSELSNYIRVFTYNRPKTKFFLRAESFYNVATEIVRISEEGGGGPLYSAYGGNLHECSHGESFIKLVQNRFTDKGLYILDEPEAALSAQRQMSLLYLIDDLVKEGSQFIIATHSPILISYINGEILDLNNRFQKVKYEDTEIYQIYKMYLDNPYGLQEKLFNEE
ncbi:MAG: AAA family ATPase [Lachnospiraceae bacterium]|nr:AAA family ATPase [Lachnospiraceae bacterium]